MGEGNGSPPQPIQKKENMGKVKNVASVTLASKFTPRSKGERFTRSQVGLQEGMVCYFQREKGIEISVLPENKYSVKFEGKTHEVFGVGEVEKISCLLKFGEKIPKGTKLTEFWKTSETRTKVPKSIGMGYEILLPVIQEEGTTKFRTLKNVYLESANWNPKEFRKSEPKILENFF